MEKSKIDNLNPQDYTHLPHADQAFEAHEQTDVAIRPLVITLVSIAVIIIVTLIGIWGLFKVLESSAESAPENQQMSNVPLSIRQVPEDFPLLQGVPVEGSDPNLPATDMQNMRAQNMKILAGKASMREGLKPGMPIEQAIDEALAKGIFKTAPTTAPTTQGQAK